MKIATYNVNGNNGRLPILLSWLKEGSPDVVCLQELKAPSDRFPIGGIEKAGYGAIWHGQKSWNVVAILSRGKEFFETRRGPPGDPDDAHSRYIEAAVDGELSPASIYRTANLLRAQNSTTNSVWFQRLFNHAASLLEFEVPVILAGDFNVIPTDLDVYAPDRWRDDALFRPVVRAEYQNLLEQG